MYSCVANDNCNYDVHVVGCYESQYLSNRRLSSSHVSINVQGQSSKPLILVLLTYRPMRWSLGISSDVVIDTVILVSTKHNINITVLLALSIRYQPSRHAMVFYLHFLFSSCTDSTMIVYIVLMIMSQYILTCFNNILFSRVVFM